MHKHRCAQKLGLWDYTLLEIGITDISFEIVIMDIKSNKKGISTHVKLGLRITPYSYFGLRDYTSFEIGITG